MSLVDGLSSFAIVLSAERDHLTTKIDVPAEDVAAPAPPEL